MNGRKPTRVNYRPLKLPAFIGGPLTPALLNAWGDPEVQAAKVFGMRRAGYTIDQIVKATGLSREYVQGTIAAGERPRSQATGEPQ